MAKSLPPTAKPHLSSFVTYSPGKPAAEVEAEFGVRKALKLASNENALGMSPRAREAVLAALDETAAYPDTNALELTGEIARRNGVAASQVMAGNGAVELIYYLAQCFLGAGDEVVTSTPSFSAYFIASRIQDATVRAAPVTGYRHDLDALRKLVTGRTKILFLANPNNPTGAHVTLSEVRRLAGNLPPYVLLVLDEAYHDFVGDPDYFGSVGLLEEGLNVLILRSLSKSLGLAGLRVGYAVASEETLRALRQVQVPFHVNSLAQRAALAGLDDREFVERSVEMVRRGRREVCERLDRAGLVHAPSETNFLWVDTGVDAQQLFERMLADGVILRPGTGFGEPSHVRITIGLPEQNERMLRSLLARIGELRSQSTVDSR